MNPLKSVTGAITSGVILALVVCLAVPPNVMNEMSMMRWLHVLSGVMWIGLLWYFNVVQMPGLGAAAADKGGPGGAGISKYIVPRALFWFRWAAVATWVTGVSYLVRNNNFANALTLGMDDPSHYGTVIGIGGWLGTIMLFNVWVFIWPNQKKVLGIVAATDEQKAAARATATTASRINFVLSIPMLVCMIGAFHGLPF
jgi:uncharacterized membrane protein